MKRFHAKASLSLAAFFGLLGLQLLAPPKARAIDIDIPVSSIPAQVVQSINQRFPGAVYLRAERDFIDQEYDVKVCHMHHLWEIELTPAGRIVDIDYEGPC